ncbi:MAG: FMN-binding negative transcriptional regulator [Novosphingobium sp.]|nr:FMN-binding negative transcriptional regulator [Novosphingobium sp.]
MHPNAAFRTGLPPAEERALMETLIEEIGFGMVFAQTPDGPRVAHVPLLSTGDGALHFHLARGNALTRHLDGATALALINGPDAYVSPRWYASSDQVPTWNYVSLELEGRVRQMDGDGLRGHIETLVERHESRLGADGPWSLDELPDGTYAKLSKGILGFEMEVRAWRPTLKLSQNKSEEDRLGVAEALDANGSPALAQLMRSLAP